MRIAGFDLATTSGCAVLDGTRVIHAAAFRPAGKTDAEIFTGFRKWFRGVLIGFDIQHVGIEQALVTDIRAPVSGPDARPGETRNPVTMKTYLRLYGLRAHAVQICGRLNVPLLEVHQATWRKSFTGNGRASKDETLALARRLVPGLASKDAAEAVGVA